MRRIQSDRNAIARFHVQTARYQKWYFYDHSAEIDKILYTGIDKINMGPSFGLFSLRCSQGKKPISGPAHTSGCRAASKKRQHEKKPAEGLLSQKSFRRQAVRLTSPLSRVATFSSAYALLSILSLSATSAMNSPLVGLSSSEHTFLPNTSSSASMRPRFHATSMA